MVVLRALPVVLVIAVALSGCAAFGEMTGISNKTNSFQFGGNIADKDGSQSFQWRNSNTCAVLQWGGRITGGSIDVLVRDASGTEVYKGSIGKGDSATIRRTQEGTPGLWTVDVTFHAATAVMGLNLFSGDNTFATRDGADLVYAGQACDASLAKTKTYSWASPGTATLEVAGQALAGSLTVQVLDAARAPLKTLTITPQNSGKQTLPLSADAGEWYLVVNYTDFTGQVAVRLQPATV